jgi:phosphosulfolactate synthase (CoM biosynthesis protein A)
MSERAFPFIRMNEREGKPRTRGITEIRGPYYTPMGKRYLEDVLETMGDYVDSLKFAGGSFTLMPRSSSKKSLISPIATTCWSPPAASSSMCLPRDLRP